MSIRFFLRTYKKYIFYFRVLSFFPRVFLLMNPSSPFRSFAVFFSFSCRHVEKLIRKSYLRHSVSSSSMLQKFSVEENITLGAGDDGQEATTLAAVFDASRHHAYRWRPGFLDHWSAPTSLHVGTSRSMRITFSKDFEVDSFFSLKNFTVRQAIFRVNLSLPRGAFSLLTGSFLKILTSGSWRVSWTSPSVGNVPSPRRPRNSMQSCYPCSISQSELNLQPAEED